jgi:hypothetical protein
VHQQHISLLVSVRDVMRISRDCAAHACGATLALAPRTELRALYARKLPGVLRRATAAIATRAIDALLVAAALSRVVVDDDDDDDADAEDELVTLIVLACVDVAHAALRGESALGVTAPALVDELLAHGGLRDRTPLARCDVRALSQLGSVMMALAPSAPTTRRLLDTVVTTSTRHLDETQRVARAFALLDIQT